jgi:hypothetical protein
MKLRGFLKNIRMKFQIILLLTCISLSSWGQTDSGNYDIDNVKTGQHINIPGTRLFIIPPPGFEIASSFTGLQKGDDIIIQVFDLIGGNFYTNAANINRETFESKGAIVFDYKELNVNGFPAKYSIIEGDQNTRSMNLVFGDTTFSVMIMALYHSIDDNAGAQIQKAIGSVYYDKNLETDPLATASFVIDETRSSFKFSQASAGVFMYSIGGIAKQSFNDEPFITIATLPKDPAANAKTISQMSLSSLEGYGFSDIELKNASTKKVNKQRAYEVEVYGKLQGQNILIYQLIVTDRDKAILIQGIVKSDFDNNLREMKNLARTIRLKRVA